MTMLIPLNGLVLIDPVKEPRNKAGILLPDCWQGKDMTGTVVQAHAKSDLKPGTWSSCRSFCPQAVKIAGRELLLVKEEELLGVVA